MSKGLAVRAQVSLEYLLVAGIMLGILGAFVGLALFVHAKGVEALDVKYAYSFAQRVQGEAQTLQVLGSGSTVLIKGLALNTWHVSVNAHTLSVSVYDAHSMLIKKIQVQVPGLDELEGTVKGAFAFSMAHEPPNLIGTLQP
ncbi:MAG: hypothetical protein HY393_00105 [Candidatus Diapherotrites archaeon]|nr:hypothetical protein [Candidatus Diapherotrites archaeon]